MMMALMLLTLGTIHKLRSYRGWGQVLSKSLPDLYTWGPLEVEVTTVEFSSQTVSPCRLHFVSQILITIICNQAHSTQVAAAQFIL